jgi:hypothetical protein
MNRYAAFAVLFVFLTWTCVCSAGLIIEGNGKSTMADDGDGVIVCTSNFLQPITEEGESVYPINVVGEHCDHTNCDVPELRGHIVGDFNVNDDPTLKIINSIDNDTGFDWTGYTVQVTMPISFTIPAAAVTTPSDWTVASIAAPSYDIGSGKWIGLITFAGGTPVHTTNDETLEFWYKLNFTGSAPAYCIEMTPVPEPGTLALLAFGAIGLFVVGRRSGR